MENIKNNDKIADALINLKDKHHVLGDIQAELKKHHDPNVHVLTAKFNNILSPNSKNLHSTLYNALIELHQISPQSYKTITDHLLALT